MPAVKSAPSPVQYQMPHTAPGEIVRYFTDPSGDPSTASAAIVVRVSGRSVELRVETSEGRNARVYDVCHIHDPILEQNENRRGNGAWDYTESKLQLQDLQDRLDALEEMVTSKK